MKRIFTILMGLVLCVGSNAQFSTPVVDGIISADEYGIHADGGNQQFSGGLTWYLTWDDTDLFVGVTGYSNTDDAVVLYLDFDPISPVNGGDNTNGNLSGTGYDQVTPDLPFRGDFFAFVKPGYDAMEFADGNGNWGNQVTGTITKANNGTNTIEFKIPWFIITGNNRPDSFNWLGFLSYSGGGGGLFSQVPTENPAGNTPEMIRYYTVSTTADGVSTLPFSQNSYTHIGGDANGFGGISVFDFTMNTSGATITRSAGTGGQWNISNDLVLGAGTIDFGSSADKATVSGNVNISSGASLTLSTAVGGDLEVGGDFTDDGTFTDNERLVLFNGNSLQSIGGSSETTFGYFTVAADAQVQVLSDKNINVDNDLTVIAAKSGKAAGQFILKSDASGTASMIVASTATMSGKVSVERFLTQGDWHFLSSPVVDQPIVGAGNFIEFPGGAGDENVDFYRFDETNTINLPWINIKDDNGNLNPDFGTPSGDPLFEEGFGYLVSYAGSDVTKTFTGVPLLETHFELLTYTSDGRQGWNLLGNPFPSAIDWETLRAANNNFQYMETGTYYIYNEAANGGGGGYEYFTSSFDHSSNTNGRIPAMQAFFVKAVDNPSASFYFSLPSRAHDDQEFLKTENTDQGRLHLKIEDNTYFSDAYITADETGITGVDHNDAFMLFSLNSQVPHIYSLAGTEKLVSNHVPFPDEDYSIPLGIRAGSTGTYTLTAVDIENFNSSILPVIEDTQTGAEVDLRFESSYTFDVSEPGVNNARFVLHLKTAVGVNEMNQRQEISVSQCGNELRFYNLGTGDYEIRISDVMGRDLCTGTLDGGGVYHLPAGIKGGTYILQLSDGVENQVRKVVLR